MVNSVITSIKIRWEDIASDSWLRQIPALHDLEHLALPRRLTIFTGENGSGKSTLLEAMAIASGFNPEGGTRNYHFATRDSHSSLHEALTLVRRPPMLRGGYFLRAESFYQTATMEEQMRSTPQKSIMNDRTEKAFWRWQTIISAVPAYFSWMSLRLLYPGSISSRWRS